MFGCRAFVHVPRDEWSKLDNKTKQTIFLGYSNEEFRYRLWDSTTKKFIRNKDVVFFEDQTIEDLDRVKKPKPFPKNRLIWVQSILTLWDIMNTWKLCKKNRLIQLKKMMRLQLMM